MAKRAKMGSKRGPQNDPKKGHFGVPPWGPIEPVSVSNKPVDPKKRVFPKSRIWPFFAYSPMGFFSFAKVKKHVFAKNRKVPKNGFDRFKK